MGGKDASRLPFPLFHRRPISTPPLTHLSRMANWAPVYSPQQRNTERKEGRGGPTTSGNHQAKRALDPEIPVSDPSPLLTPPPLASTQPLHHHLSSPSVSLLHSSSLLLLLPPSLPLLPSSRLPIISMSLRAVGLIQTDCLTVSKTYSLSQTPLLPLSVLCSSRGTDTLFHGGGGAGVSLAWVSRLLLHRTISGGIS